MLQLKDIFMRRKLTAIDLKRSDSGATARPVPGEGGEKPQVVPAHNCSLQRCDGYGGALLFLHADNELFFERFSSHARTAYRKRTIAMERNTMTILELKTNLSFAGDFRQAHNDQKSKT
jgi:hypothetical protein